MAEPFIISASALKLFFLCPRSWFLKWVLRAQDDEGAGGLYLTRGNDFDRLVQLRVRDGVRGDPGAPKLANRQLAVAERYLPAHGGAEVQFKYRIPVPGHPEFVVTGKPDLRQPGFIRDTKTTSDRGPGVGAASDRPAYALTNETLLDDVQARLYAWCEFQLNPDLLFCSAEWIYVSKADAPKAWTARCHFGRADTLAWFERVVMPAAQEMARLAESGLRAEDVGANPDSCRRCFVRRACPGPFEGVNVYGLSEPQKRSSNMPFDLSSLSAAPAAPKPAPKPELEEQLAASLQLAKTTPTNRGGMPGVVAINRPASERPVSVARVEGPGAALVEVVDTEGEEVASEPEDPTRQANTVAIVTASPVVAETGTTEAPPAPKARRGRPRKDAPTFEETPAVSAVGQAEETDPKGTTAAGCAPSAGSPAASVGVDVTLARELLQRALAALGGAS